MVSIIMPVYNIEKISAFRSATKSVLKQTYHDIEFIMVNDGSTDNTEEVLYNLKGKDSRIHIITKNNGGVESARREGIHFAHGDYLFHIDQDDLLAVDSIEKMVNAAERYRADVVVGDSVHFFRWKPLVKYPHDRENIILDHKDFMQQYYKGFFGQNLFPVQIWNKLYRKSFIDTIPTPPKTGLYNEDFNYNIHVLPEASKIVWLSDVTYYYRWGGFTCKKIKGLQDVALSCYRIEMEQIKKYNLKEFEPSTSIELLNFMNSVVFQEIQLSTDGIEVRQMCQQILAYPEVKHAIKIVQFGSNYRNSHIDKMLLYDVDGWVGVVKETVKQQKLKTAVKRLLIHIR